MKLKIIEMDNQEFTVERVKIDGVWYIIVYDSDGKVYAQFVDPNQND